MELNLNEITITPGLLVNFNEIQKQHSEFPFEISSLGPGNTHNRQQIFEGITITFSTEQIDSVIALLQFVKKMY